MVVVNQEGCLLMEYQFGNMKGLTKHLTGVGVYPFDEHDVENAIKAESLYYRVDWGESFYYAFYFTDGEEE